MNIPRVRPWREFLVSFSCVLVVQCASAAPGDENWDANFGIPGVEGRVYAMACSENLLYVGGDFLRIGGIQATNVAKWDGKNWHPLGPGLGQPNRGVWALLVADGRLFAGGLFTNTGAQPISQVASWNGTEWISLAGPPSAGIFALAWDGKKLFAGGSFISIGGISASNVAAWDGTNWMPLGVGVHKWRIGITGPQDLAKVHSLATRGTNVYVGGEFETAGNANATNIAKWSGDDWIALGGRMGLVRTLAADSTFVYAGADAGIHFWNGQVWVTQEAVSGSFYGSVRVITICGKEVYAAGWFSAIGSAGLSNVGRWSGSQWFSLGAGIHTSGSVLAMASNGTELFVGGSFNAAGGKPATNIARWRIPHELKIKRAGNDALISWPATGSNLTLEVSTNLVPPVWSNVSEAVSFDGEQCVVTNAISGRRFFRLSGR